MFFRILKSKKGFSLVELMTVVVVLGILSAVAVPMFVSAYNAQARKDCKNQVTVIEAQVKEAMAGMIDNGAAQYKTELVGGIEKKYLWIDFSKIQDDHKAKYAADDVEGNSDDVYNNRQCFVLIKSQDIPGKIAFTLSDLRGGYRPNNIPDYNKGCEHGYYLKKEKLKNVEFYKYLANEEIPICPFSNPDKNEIYYYYIFDDGEVICSCPKCHEN